jgi:DNA-binding NarL/FixJ family response regulator
MKHLFIGTQPQLETQWQAAFSSDAQLINQLEGVDWSSVDFIWLMDDFPGVSALLKGLRSQSFKVVILSLTPSVQASLRFFEEGALGYCHALAAPSMLQHVVDSVQAGDIWLGAELMQQMVHRLVKAQESSQSVDLPQLGLLTAKEKLVAELVAKGFTNKEVAKQLAITDRTVKAHLTAVFDKLGVRDRVHLALLLKA